MAESNPNAHTVGRYKITKAMSEANPRMAAELAASVADILDHGYCAEIQKCRDGTPKVIQAKREIK